MTKNQKAQETSTKIVQRSKTTIMSGFLSDVASWALRGSGNANGEEEEEGSPAEPMEQLTAEEMRAQRLARITQLQSSSSSTEAMEVDSPKQAATPAPAPTPPKPAAAPVVPAPPPPPKQTTSAEVGQSKKKKPRSEASPSDAARKHQRKKEMLLKKVLQIALAGTPTASDSSVAVLELASTEVSVQTISDILSTRIDYQATSSSFSSRPLLAYLAASHRRTAEELQSFGSTPKKANTELVELLQEIQKQLVSYAASCLMLPDLFEAASNSNEQLANLLMDMNNVSITFGVGGTTSSFYYSLVEEILREQRDEPTLDQIVNDVVLKVILPKLKRCESALDGECRALVTALTNMCSHKKVTEAIARLDGFMLPAVGSPEAAQLIHPHVPRGNLLQMFAPENRPFKGRSGPALESTLIGAVLKNGIPKNNPGFSPTSILSQSLDSVERTYTTQRIQLQIHQEACCQFIRALVKPKEAREKVMQWFLEALLVNSSASALRLDATKVSSSNLLLNLSVVLLKLCEPVVMDEEKIKYINPGFVSSEADHRGVYATSGDDFVARLGNDDDDDLVMTEAYNPTNTFIPLVFFVCARSLHFGIVPGLSHHESLLSHISRAHYEITSSGRDLRSDPHFGMRLSQQRSTEVFLFQPSMVEETLRFCNLMANFLSTMDDDVLKTMPEDFVSDLCGILMSIAKMKAKLLGGVDLRHVFTLVVKLLSAKYATVRNYVSCCVIKNGIDLNLFLF
jgi:hypothetical protein